MVKQRTRSSSLSGTGSDSGRNASKWLWPILTGAATLSASLALSSPAHASGIAAARFGGEHGHPTTDNATAIYYNPAGLALAKGTHIFVDTTLALRWASYERPAAGPSDVAPDVTPVQNSQSSLELAPGSNDGRATLFNAIAAPFLGVNSDFGTDFMAGGLALYFPFGGSAVWDKNSLYNQSQQFPGAVDGQQRWYSIDGTIRSMYVSGALAFKVQKIGLSIGISGSAIRSEVSTIRARNADGTDDLVIVNADDSTTLKEGRSQIDVNGWQGGFGIGLIYDVAKLGKYFIGASYTSQPNVVGGMTLKGELTNAFGTAPVSTSKVELQQTLPEIIRFGVRIRPTDKYELRLFGDFTRWSVFDKQCVLDSDVDDRNCNFPGGDKALDDPASFGASEEASGVTQHLPRFWKNAGGVRVGGSYWFIPQVEGFLGAGYDSSAVPVETLDPALIDMDKVSVSIGARWQIIRHLALSFTATELIFFRTSTEGKSALNKFDAPTKQPSGDGVYNQFFQLFNIYADISF